MTVSGRAAPSPTSRLTRGKIALFFSAFIIITLALCEAGARIYLRLTAGYDGKHLYQYAFDPYKNILPAPGFVDTRGIRHNQQGFRRDSEVSKTKPPGTFRIFLMGGSTAYGLGGLWPHIQDTFEVLPNSNTIDAYLEQDLASAFPGVHVEVINAAITSTWTHHHLIYLNQTILGFDPDMVLFLDGYNDFYFHNRRHDQFGDYLYTVQSQTILGDPTIHALLYANAWWLFRKSAFANLLGRGAKNLGRALASHDSMVAMNVPKAIAGLREVFPRSALKMQERAGLILRHEGVMPVFMLQPMLILEREKPKPPIEQKLFDFNVKSYLPNYEEFIHQAVPFIHERETQMASELGAEFIDLTDIYRHEPEQTFTDYAHLTPRGNEILARIVAARLEPLIVRILAADSARARTQPKVAPH